jgi:hypothetical protein
MNSQIIGCIVRSGISKRDENSKGVTSRRKLMSSEGAAGASKILMPLSAFLLLFFEGGTRELVATSFSFGDSAASSEGSTVVEGATLGL